MAKCERCDRPATFQSEDGSWWCREGECGPGDAWTEGEEQESSLSRYGSPTVPRCDPQEAGCMIDGWWGQYGTDRLLEIAQSCGFTPADERDAQLLSYSGARLVAMAFAEDDEPIAEALAALMPHSDDVLADEWQIADEVISLADDAEAWLNQYVAPDGYAFGWDDGEFFLSPIDDDR